MAKLALLSALWRLKLRLALAMAAGGVAQDGNGENRGWRRLKYQ